MKILIFICGEGLGHTTRSLAVGQRLAKEGVQVTYCAYGYSKKHIDGLNLPVTEIPSEIKLVGTAGSLDLRDSIEETIKNTDPRGYSRVAELIKKENPDLVITDSYFTAAIAGKRLKKPVILILNQTNIYNFFKNKGIDAALVGKIVTKFADTVFRYVDLMVIPDFPPPYTVCEKNIELNAELVKSVEYVGPLVRKTPDEVEEIGLRKPHVLSSIGGFGYREKLFSNVLAAASNMQDYNFTLLAGPNVNPKVLEGRITPNVNVLTHLDNVFPYIKASETVIAPGGHSTIMECLSFGKPVISVPDMFHSEQENNATKLSELGLGVKLSYFTPPIMIEDCIRDSKIYAANATKTMNLSRKLDGPGRILKLAEKLL